MPPSPLITINKQLDFHTQSTKSRSFSNYSTKSYHRTPLAPPPTQTTKLAVPTSIDSPTDRSAIT